MRLVASGRRAAAAATNPPGSCTLPVVREFVLFLTYLFGARALRRFGFITVPVISSEQQRPVLHARGIRGWQGPGRAVLIFAALATFGRAAGAQTLAWDANTEPNLLGYYVVLGPAPGSEAQRIDVGKVTTYAVPSLPASPYYAWVLAYNAAGVSLPSNVVTVSSGAGPESGGSGGGGVPGDNNGDGLPDDWQAQYGVTDSAADPDGDGLTNRQEWEHRTDPTIPNHVVLPGNPAGPFVSRLALTNPGNEAASGVLTFLTSSGERTWAFVVDPHSRATVPLSQFTWLPDDTAAIVVDIDAGGVLVERLTRWGAPAGATGSAMTAAVPSTTWYLAEGDAGTNAAWLMLANDGRATANVSVNFLTTSGPVIARTYAVAARTQQTVRINDISGVAGTTFSVAVQSDAPVTVARAIFFNGPISGWVGGDTKIGARAPASTWVLPEGRLGFSYETWLLFENPQPSTTSVDVTWLRTALEPVRTSYSLPPSGRTSLRLSSVAELVGVTQASAVITASAPIVVEESMYWPRSRSSDVGTTLGTQPATRCLLAEGEVGGTDRFETYVVIANPGATAATVTVTFLREVGNPIVIRRTVWPQSRAVVNTGVAGVPAGERFGVLVRSTVPVGVERTMFWTLPGTYSKGGTTETATRLRE